VRFRIGNFNRQLGDLAQAHDGPEPVLMYLLSCPSCGVVEKLDAVENGTAGLGLVIPRAFRIIRLGKGLRGTIFGCERCKVPAAKQIIEL
jgi:hypothetical protein